VQLEISCILSLEVREQGHLIHDAAVPQILRIVGMNVVKKLSLGDSYTF
jgi:hypothetical protein